MDQVKFSYSMKNIPIPPRNTYMKSLIEKIESVIKRMSWKAFFYDKPDTEDRTDNKFGFRSKTCPPQHNDLSKFEADLLNMAKNVRFKKSQDQFQQQLKKDIKQINSSSMAFVPADKTTNLYKLDKDQYSKLLHDSITATYKKADENSYDGINGEAKKLASELNISDRMECMAKQQAFVTLKDHKENFQNKPSCRLINPAKSELGLVSKKIIVRINNTIRNKTGVNQWKNSASVIEWFKEIPNKSRHTFLSFDIDNFYPSISVDLLRNSIDYAKKHISISEQDINIIMHARKSLLFTKETPLG